MTIMVIFNGEKVDCPNNLNLTNFIKLHVRSPGSAAVAINNDFVAKSNYSLTLIKEGDVIEIVSPVTGG